MHCQGRRTIWAKDLLTTARLCSELGSSGTFTFHFFEGSFLLSKGSWKPRSAASQVSGVGAAPSGRWISAGTAPPFFRRCSRGPQRRRLRATTPVQRRFRARHGRKKALLLKLSPVDPLKRENPRQGFSVLGWCIFGDLFRRNKVTSATGSEH